MQESSLPAKKRKGESGKLLKKLLKNSGKDGNKFIFFSTGTRKCWGTIFIISSQSDTDDAQKKIKIKRVEGKSIKLKFRDLNVQVCDLKGCNRSFS